MVSLNSTVCWEPVKPEVLPNCNNLQDVTIGNQQESLPSEVELAYLGGLIDGEGSFWFCVTFHKKSDKYRRLIANFSLNNTEKLLTDKAYDICKRAGINLRYRNHSAKLTKKQVWIVETNKLANTRKLIKLVLPYLIGKRERAQLMLDFIEHRIKRVKETPICTRIPYDPYEIELAEKVRSLNGRRSSEAIRGALEKTR